MREESHKMSTASNQRPFTAVSKFSASLHKSIQSMVKQNNEYKRTHGQSVQIPMTRSNGPRNLTTVGRRSVRPSTGASMNTLNIKTMERKNARNAYSSYSIGFKSKKKKKKNGVKVENIEFSSQPNEEYQILFENIPKAVYDIETEESPFFQKASRSVNLMLEGDNKGESMVYLPVERQLTSCTSLYFIKTQENSDDFNPEIKEPQYFNDLRVRALLLEKASNPSNQEPGEDSDDGNETEYEEEFYYDRNSSCYRCGLEPGKYMLVVDGDDLAQYSETIDIYEGSITQDIILKKKDKKVFLFCVRNGQTGENINSSIVKFKKKTSKSVSEVITDERGI